MPVTVELKYEYFNTWAGRVKIVELVRDFWACIFWGTKLCIIFSGLVLHDVPDLKLTFENLKF